MRPELGGFDDVDRMADGGDQHFGLEIRVVVVDRHDVGDQFHAVLADIVQPADEGRNERRTGLGRQQRLRGGKAQRHIGHHAFAVQRFARPQPVRRQRQLHAHIARDLPQHRSFPHHALILRRRHFGADRPRYDGADFGHNLQNVAARLGDQARVGGHPIDQAGGGKRLDLGGVSGIDKEFHPSGP